MTCENFAVVLRELRKERVFALDTETTGLRPHHGDRLFSIIIATEGCSYYFNWNPDSYAEQHLEVFRLDLLAQFLMSRRNVIWYLHNAKFDLAMLATCAVQLRGIVWDTLVGARLEYSDHEAYNLAACAKRIGEEKDEAVEKYISAHGLWEWEQIPGKLKREKRKFYDKVPWGVIWPYGCRDGHVTFALGEHQRKTFREQDRRRPATVAPLGNVLRMELELTRTTFAMEECGVLLDRGFCVRAIEHEEAQLIAAVGAFKAATGRDYVVSPLLYAELWGEHPARSFTPKKNLCFDGDALERLAAAGAVGALEVVAARQAKARRDYYHGFLYHADDAGRIHTHFNSSGTKTGRFSSSEPNLQNLETVEEGVDVSEFQVRRAIVPMPGYVFYLPDLNQAEYRLFLDYCGAQALIEKVLGGLDVHTATAELAGITRPQAKTANFAKVYGSGIRNLAAKLKVSLAVAQRIVDAIDLAAPEMAAFTRIAAERAEQRGYVVNWLGRRWHLDDSRFSYRATNFIMQGGVGDIAKVGMNRCHRFLLERRAKSRLVLNVHDELGFEIHESELGLCRELHTILEAVYPHRRLPLTWGAAWSARSLADKQKGFPT